MKKKESVVVFEGEDKFIKPRARTYDVKSGKSEFVGLTADDPSVPRTADGTSLGYSRGTFVMPAKDDPLFCEKIKTYINTNGGGTATPEAIMSAYNAFNNFCKSEPASNTTTETTTFTTTQTTTVSTSTVTDTTTLPPATVMASPLTMSNLGTRPSAGGGGGGGKEDEKAKSKNVLWILLAVAAIGGAAYYYYRKKN